MDWKIELVNVVPTSQSVHAPPFDDDCTSYLVTVESSFQPFPDPPHCHHGPAVNPMV